MEVRPPQPIALTRAALVGDDNELGPDAQASPTFAEALHVLALETRLSIGAHQSAVSYVPLGDFTRAIHTHSFSDKYERYNSYDVMPTGKGIWGLVVREKQAVRMTEAELYGHPMFRRFSELRDSRGLEHPPMRGWLAAPVLKQSGDLLGVLQYSDKIDGDFTSDDLSRVVQLASLTSPTFELHYVNQHSARIQAALREKETLLREVHHRVKNNLQVISSLLTLQARAEPDPNTKRILAESQSRVQSIALVHEKLYQSKDLARVDFAQYLAALVANLLHNHDGTRRGITSLVEVADLKLPVDLAIPCGMIVNELFTNALRHAFPVGRGGTIRVTARTSDATIELCVQDDGVGFPLDADPRNSASLGLELVFTFAEQIGAEIEVRHDQGTAFHIRFRSP